jgi:hypothetical protein
MFRLNNVAWFAMNLDFLRANRRARPLFCIEADPRVTHIGAFRPAVSTAAAISRSAT